MYQYYQNIVTVPTSFLINQNIMSKHNYDYYQKTKKIQVVRRGCKGTPALVSFDSLPEIFKIDVVDLLGDPTSQVKTVQFSNYLLRDDKTVQFFNDYSYLKDGHYLPLPEKSRELYINQACIFNACRVIDENLQIRRKVLGNTKTKIWERFAEITSELPKHTWENKLPNNARRFKNKYQKYIKEGFESLIHGQFGNNSSEKLCESAQLWCLQRWADPIDKCATLKQLLNEYNAVAPSNGWKPILSDGTLKNYLYRENVKEMWWGFRYGELKSKEKFMYQHKTLMPSMRDSLWYSDGTKHNYYYLNDEGKIKTLNVYMVMDAYSEVFLGYHISETENYEAQYGAYKMALQTAGHKPYQIKFDNQGGHKKLEVGNFLPKLTRLATNSAPYNGKSKTIESAFGRFQQEYMKKDWFFTGQNVDTKSIESKVNMEFILANKDKLPNREGIEKALQKRLAEWHNAKHHKSEISRMQMYYASSNPQTPEVALWDMIDIFWIEREKAVTVTPFGISYTDKKVKYDYMVYDENNLPDIEWLAQHIDKKVVIKYDPDDRSIIQLYERLTNGDLRRITQATTKVEIHRNKQEQEEWEASWIKQIEERIKAYRVQKRDEMLGIMKQHGTGIEERGFTLPKIKGIETGRKKRKDKSSVQNGDSTTIGQHQKELSNQTEIEHYSNKY